MLATAKEAVLVVAPQPARMTVLEVALEDVLAAQALAPVLALDVRALAQEHVQVVQVAALVPVLADVPIAVLVVVPAVLVLAQEHVQVLALVVVLAAAIPLVQPLVLITVAEVVLVHALVVQIHVIRTAIPAAAQWLMLKLTRPLCEIH